VVTPKRSRTSTPRMPSISPARFSDGAQIKGGQL
jgi:hypothetical protein